MTRRSEACGAATISLCLISLASAVPAAAAGSGPCDQVRDACAAAGFAQGSAPEGSGLWIDCVVPILEARPQRPKASRALPSVDPALVAACRKAKPDYGQAASGAARRVPAKDAAMSSLPGNPFRRTIAGISVANEKAVLGPPSVARPVVDLSLGPVHLLQPTINEYGSGNLVSLSDEHSTIFPPGTFSGHQDDYLFFAAPKGVVVLSSRGPDASGQWTLDYASDYGLYWPGATPGSRNGPVFQYAYDHLTCPTGTVAGGMDPTFDLNYALPGSVVLDPTGPAGRRGLLMVYEGTNKCFGASGTGFTKGFYSTIGIATSADEGRTWPVYAAGYTPLAALAGGAVPSSSPMAPTGAFGGGTCQGGASPTCVAGTDPGAGRYAVLSGPVSLSAIDADKRSGQDVTLQKGGLGDSAPAGFVDTVHTEKGLFLYVVHNAVATEPGDDKGLAGCLAATWPGTGGGLKIARARLDGPRPLVFSKWYGPHVDYAHPDGSFDSTSTAPSAPLPPPCIDRVTGATSTPAIHRSNLGLGEQGGGLDSPLFPPDPAGGPTTESYRRCQTPKQHQSFGSLSYSAETREYLLTFVCGSPTDPAHPTSPGAGAAWFYATLDAAAFGLDRQDRWSAPREIDGSWGPVGAEKTYDGWYPSFMSPGQPSGTLGTTGYVFYLSGPIDQGKRRTYSTRQFTLSLSDPPACSNPAQCCIQAGGTWDGRACQ